MKTLKTLLVILGIVILLSILAFESFYLFKSFTKPKTNLTSTSNPSVTDNSNSTIKITPTTTVAPQVKDTEEFYASLNSLKLYTDLVTVNLQYTGTITAIVKNIKTTSASGTRIVIKTKSGGLVNFTFTPEQLSSIKIHENGKTNILSFDTLKIGDIIILNKTLQTNSNNNTSSNSIEITKTQ